MSRVIPRPVINDDGVSVKGCSFIYAPRGQAGDVDLFKIGRANYVPSITKVLDWEDYTLRMLDKVTKLGVKYYFKKDLQPYLPPGLPNPLRIRQHH